MDLLYENNFNENVPFTELVLFMKVLSEASFGHSRERFMERFVLRAILVISNKVILLPKLIF